MNFRAKGLLALALVISPAMASATQVSWLIGGEIATVANTPDTIQPGYLFSFVMTFDTDTPVSNPVGCGDGGAGTTCRHNFGTLFFSDITVNGLLFGDFNPDPFNNTQIVVRNDASFDLGTPGNPDVQVVDGYGFSGNELSEGGTRLARFFVSFRGPEDLGIVTDGRLLPGYPPLGLLGLRQTIFEYCDGDAVNGGLANCDNEYILGDIRSVSRVPEPGSFALLGLGLAGLALGRRRKTG
jgi:hypothetical protein